MIAGAGPEVPESIRRIEHEFTATGQPGSLDFTGSLDSVVAFQRERVILYGQYLTLLGDEAAASPHLPIRSFRHEGLSVLPLDQADAVFVSSGTSRTGRARHFVHRLSVYEASLRTNFERHFGTGPYTIVAYLPGYEDAGGSSSLLYMVRCLIRNYGDEESGFFFGRQDALRLAIEWSGRYGTRLIMIGVAFGLLDLLDQDAWPLPAGSTVIETGGMKTHRREVSRKELHELLATGFNIDRSQVISEYGMTELLSQCYTRGSEIFYPPAWMRVEIRNPENPLERQPEGVPGVLAVADLANLYSVSAILTEDLGEQMGDGFRVLGRLNGAQLRGCNLLFETLG